MRFRWRESNDEYRTFQQRPEGVVEGYRGERFVQTELGRLGVYPDGMIYYEGRAAAFLAGDPRDHSLAAVQDLTSAEQAALIIAEQNGMRFSEGSLARLGRIDLAAELRFDEPDEGSAFLHSLAALDVPWCKSRVDGRKGSHLETVSFHGTRGSTIYLRAYDKGIESGTHSPGKRIRVERQKRYRKTKEPRAVDLNVLDFQKAYVGREFARLAELPSATVCNVPDAADVLWERAETWSQFERLAGYITMGAYIAYPEHIEYRRQAELRNLGIFVDPAQNERIDVPVGRYLETLATAWAV